MEMEYELGPRCSDFLSLSIFGALGLPDVERFLVRAGEGDADRRSGGVGIRPRYLPSGAMTWTPGSVDT